MLVENTLTDMTGREHDQLTRHHLTNAIRVVAAEKRLFLVAIDDNVVSAYNVGGRIACAKVLQIDTAIVAPSIDVVFGMLGELNRLVQALTKLVGFRSITARVDAKLVDGAGIPGLLFYDIEGFLSLGELDGVCGS